MAKQDDYVRYTIRVPADLYRRISDLAEFSNRSVNAEVIALLKSAVGYERVVDNETASQVIEEMAERFMLIIKKLKAVQEAQEELTRATEGEAHK